MTSERTPLVEQDIDDVSSSYDSIQPITSTGPLVTKPTPLPKLQLFNIFFIQIGEPLTATVIYPFIVQLVRDTGITGGDEARTGYFAGFIESIFFMAEGLTALQWGRASDRFGRKLPLVFGTLGLAASITAFGLCKTFWPLVFCRCVQGMFNGNIGITRGVMAEITDASNIAQAFGLIPLMWGTGIIFGPVIGGLLSHPADRWPQTLGKIAFFSDYPYFLPCIAVAMVPLSAFIFSILFLEETLTPVMRKKKHASEEESLLTEQLSENTDMLVTNGDQSLPRPSLMTRRVVISLVNYAFLAFIEQCCDVLMPLVYATSIPYGGLGFTSFTIGIIMSVLGIIIGVPSAIFFPKLMRAVGIYRIYRISFPCYLVIIASFPLMNVFATRAGYVDWRVCHIWMIQLSCCTATTVCFSCMFIYFNDSAPSKTTIGAVNGLAQTVACSARVFAPLMASSLFSFSQQHNLLGRTLVYWILCIVVIVGIFPSSQLPRHLQSKEG